MATSSTMTAERYPLIELEGGNKTRAVTFAANGEYFVSGDENKVRVWRVEGGEPVATMAAGLVNCLAASKDGRFIAAGTFSGEVIVWDAHKPFRKVLTLNDHYVIGLDFSPDSTKLLTASFNCTATIWDVTNRERAFTFRHDDEIIAARYSQRGDRIAVATGKHIRIYDSERGRLLVDIRAEVTPWYNTGLIWSNDQLLIVSENKIKQIDAITGSLVVEWPVPDSDASSCIALQRHAEFVAYSANRTVTIWDTSDRNTQLDVIQHTQIIRSIAISPDDRFLAVAGERGKILIRRLPRSMTDSIPLSRLHPTFREPDIRIHDTALESWKQGQFANAEELLTMAIPTSTNPGHLLASRALIRTQLQQWDLAFSDAEESIKARPSALGYIAKSVALVSKGEKYKGYRACDIAFERFHSSHVSFLLLIKAIIVFKAGEHSDAISRLDDLIATVRFNSICYVVQAQMYLLLGNSHMEGGEYEEAVQSFEHAQSKIRHHTSRPLSAVSLISGWEFDGLEITIRQRLCDALHATGRTNEAVESFVKLVNMAEKEGDSSRLSPKWISCFAQRCLSIPGSDSNVPSRAAVRLDNVTTRDATTSSPTQILLLREWVKAKLTSGSWQDALTRAVNFTLPRSIIYRAVCGQLEVVGRVADATECFQQMIKEPATGASISDEEAKWAIEFKVRCAGKLEHLGDSVMKTQKYDEAISRYSAALSLDLVVPQSLFIKRSKAYIAAGSWEDALNDANKVIMLDPSSPCGYERKHAALHKAGSYDEAIAVFKTMLSTMMQSPDQEVREHCRQYIDPAQTEAAIRKAVQDTIRDIPRVLINTASGRLFDKSKQAASFESLSIFKELVSSMTTHIDYARIEHEVTEYYRYATLSHTWESDEPLFEKIIQIMVYDLDKYPTHDKLQMFCRIVQDAGFNWAWSDTCCINKTDNVVLQEALVAMFKWYEGSALTIIYLRGVCSTSRRGDLIRSIWNTRAWTLQEYHASKVVRFYTEDWTPYLNLDTFNHKESPEIISEMEEATHVSARALMTLRPGLNDIREKLCLASRRETTLVEDAAYSLLGIFSMYLPVVYGEGDEAVGRLLRQLLASSGDTSILAWTGKSGSLNSCLPAKTAVFAEYPPSHVPAEIEESKMEVITTKIRNSPLSSASIMKLYDKLQGLPVPSFSEKRMKLPCLVFKLGSVSETWTPSGRIFRAMTDALGVVEVATTEDLSQLDPLILVHPWIDFLLDRRPIAKFTGLISADKKHRRLSAGTSSSSSGASITAQPTQQKRTSVIARIQRSFTSQPRDTTLPPPPASLTDKEKRPHALRLIARLRQPFGALLFTPVRRNVSEYRRVAAESTITVRVQEDTPLEMLIDSVRMLDVL